jgi:Dockerin type I domain
MQSLRLKGQDGMNSLCNILKASMVYLAIGLAGVAQAQSPANCPFDVDGSGARRATTDGLLLQRHANGGFGSNTPSKATEAPGLTAAQIGTHVTNNLARLDIDGDGKFSELDALVIIRYLMGFRGDNLAGGLITKDLAKRYGGTAYQAFIDQGCTGLNDSPDPRVTVWNAMNAAFAAGNLSLGKTYLTPNGIAILGGSIDALAPQLPTIVASYSSLIAKEVSETYAEYWVSRPIVGHPNNARQIHSVIFVYTLDGQWRIDSM